MTRRLPIRQCLGCREHRPKGEMIRIVRGTDGTVFPDFSGKANGRGAYLCRNPECIRKAEKSRSLERALDTKLPQGLMERMTEEIMKADNYGKP
ncbi:MAG: YlxR family protein [Oscillospiraceae bacterium]|nr:YlxR family protein [Oscillospiraceae bacterium]